MFSHVLVANRGEIAVRIVRACRRLGVEAVVVHSDPDAGSLAVALADRAVGLPGVTAAETYLDVERVVHAAVGSGCDAVHPGYGFLAERAELAAAVTAAGLTWVGPPAEVIALMGDKLAARRVARDAGVDHVPGATVATLDAAAVLAFGDELGWPLAVKAVHGGGGRGMRVLAGPDEVAGALEAARREARASFGRDELYVERYLAAPRHVEVQVVADHAGTVVVAGDRDCSIQRRYQKLIEEAPAPRLGQGVRATLHEAATRLAEAVRYRNVGTVEFLVEGAAVYFLEMNTRIQVEHPVTELVTGVDLVVEQLRLAAGEAVSFTAADVSPRGAAIEVRLNAEDTAGGRFLPSPGILRRFDLPTGPGVRIDTGYRAGDELLPHYDNLIAKISVWGADREAARRAAIAALGELRVEGVPTTAGAAAVILAHDDFRDVRHSTRWLAEHAVALLPPGGDEGPAGAAGPDGAEGTGGTGGTSADGGEAGTVVADRDVHLLGRWFRVPRFDDDAATGRGAGPAGPVGGGPPRGRPRPASGPAGAATGPGARRGPGTGRVTAPMQGTVIVVDVTVGDLVGPDSRVVVLEAMKMENALVAGASGVVRAVHVTPGTNVAPGTLLVEVAVEEEGP